MIPLAKSNSTDSDASDSNEVGQLQGSQGTSRKMADSFFLENPKQLHFIIYTIITIYNLS